MEGTDCELPPAYMKRHVIIWSKYYTANSWQGETFKSLGLSWQCKGESVKECSLMLAEEMRWLSCEERTLWKLQGKKRKVLSVPFLKSGPDVKCKIVLSGEMVSLWVLFGSLDLLSITWTRASVSSFSALEEDSLSTVSLYFFRFSWILSTCPWHQGRKEVGCLLEQGDSEIEVPVSYTRTLSSQRWRRMVEECICSLIPWTPGLVAHWRVGGGICWKCPGGTRKFCWQ